MTSNTIIFITGPTAVGKTGVATALAQKIDGEIISCDSIQIYREINILSCKPTKDEQSQVPYHLVDVASIADHFDVVQFNRMALEAIEDIHAREKIPVIVGGSGLYMQVLLDGIFDGVKGDQELRDKLFAEAAAQGNQRLYDRLKEKDPTTASKIHFNDTKRIVRALEVCEVTGEMFSSLQEKREGIWGKYDIKLYCLNRDREVLYDRINQRVDQMLEDGLIEEMNSLKNEGIGQTAAAAIGFAQIQKVWDGEVELEQAVEMIKKNTRNFAKRQLTWFRGEERLKWIDITENDTVDDVVETIINDN